MSTKRDAVGDLEKFSAHAMLTHTPIRTSFLCLITLFVLDLLVAYREKLFSKS